MRFLPTGICIQLSKRSESYLYVIRKTSPQIQIIRESLTNLQHRRTKEKIKVSFSGKQKKRLPKLISSVK